ncbi:hypothetical protein EMIHUDRAFT_194397 [Emiliania huxleyi CCMP1516]|uniref:Uncharacterized protein n=2 Tax=Emiliania huxleyi TaxID=2903 RepID=A0A0D3L1F8_EMIH1|nr:hypothetical protein EMIHUDRAFT_194397 [Emiliania huxleyi CCMP1516]EOD41843.1 hypothetical protein EMIHUDRAFT_194397 [Emiliania huxleyi CCMP1516]|eukprot:XP_005794272.1 hypothetical protein EMIHUDRAFT_194397 [Emiliania huxleyi CCMP1516]
MRRASKPLPGGELKELCLLPGGELKEPCLLPGGELKEPCLLPGGELKEPCLLPGGELKEPCSPILVSKGNDVDKASGIEGVGGAAREQMLVAWQQLARVDPGKTDEARA